MVAAIGKDASWHVMSIRRLSRQVEISQNKTTQNPMDRYHSNSILKVPQVTTPEVRHLETVTRC